MVVAIQLLMKISLSAGPGVEGDNILPASPDVACQITHTVLSK